MEQEQIDIILRELQRQGPEENKKEDDYMVFERLKEVMKGKRLVIEFRDDKG